MAPIKENEAKLPIHERLIQKGKEKKDKIARGQTDGTVKPWSNQPSPRKMLEPKKTPG